MAALRYIALFLLLALAGCSGYSFGEGGGSVLPPEYRTLAVGEVRNPTTLAWLEPRLRKLLRDELNNRGAVTWVDDRADADALISLDVQRYYRPTAVEGKDDQTLLTEAIFQFRAVIRSTTDESVIWSSGLINQTWPYATGNGDQADKEVTRLGIQRLADRMSQAY